MSPEVNRGPVSPVEAAELHKIQIPEEVFSAFNSLIAEKLRSGYARVLQKDVLALLEDQGMDRNEIFEKHWLDVEDSYREAGWKVSYDRPVYYAGENFDAYFDFKDSRKY